MTLTSLLAFVSAAVAAKRREPSKDHQIAELKEKLRICEEKLRICEAARDAARADRDRSDALQLLRHSRETLMRLDSKRAQAPRHLPLPIAPPLYPQEQAQVLTAPIMGQMDQILHEMERVICNCAPGRHELFVRPSPIDVERDYDALFGKSVT